MKNLIPILMCSLPVLFTSCALPAKQPQPWRGVHVPMTSSDRTEQLTEAVGRLADIGINVIIAEINYGYEYDSHPQLRAANPSRKDQIKKPIASIANKFVQQCSCLAKDKIFS